MANTKKYISLDKLGVYDEKIKGVISTGDATTLQAAKDYADGLAPNYEAAGNAATEAGKVQAELDKEVARAKAAEEANAAAAKQAQDEIDALELVVAGKAAQTDLDALAGKVGEVPEGSTVMGIITNIQENAYDDTAIQNAIAGLESTKADKTQVATDIETAVNAEKSARETAVAGVQGAVDTLAGTHATDKAALEGAIALKADITALNAVSDVANAAVKQADYDVKVKALEDEDARIVGLVEAEAERAAGVEAGLEERLVEVETFFKTAEGQTIDEAMDTLVEIQKYITDDGAAADEMVKNIAANAKAIADHVATDHDFAAADEALKSELEGKINGKVAQGDFDAVEGRVDVLEGEMDTVEGKVSTLEGKMIAVEGAVATKAEAQALTDAVAALEGVDAGLAGRISTLEGKFGGAEGSVEDMIADAKQAAIDTAAADAETKANAAKDAAIAKANELNTAMDTRVAAVEAASATHALASDLTALGNRVTAEEGKVSTLQTEMDAVEALAAANESAIKALQTASANYALKSEVEAVGNRVTALETWHNNFTEASEEEINGLFA